MAPASPEIEAHLEAFADAFVEKLRRPRWRYVLSMRPKNARREASSLINALDPSCCVQVDGAFGIDANARGVFYDFVTPPRMTTLGEAVKLANHRDAIFSVTPGRLAVHFSHEGWSWLCRK